MRLLDAESWATEASYALREDEWVMCMRLLPLRDAAPRAPPDLPLPLRLPVVRAAAADLDAALPRRPADRVALQAAFVQLVAAVILADAGDGDGDALSAPPLAPAAPFAVADPAATAAAERGRDLRNELWTLQRFCGYACERRAAAEQERVADAYEACNGGGGIFTTEAGRPQRRLRRLRRRRRQFLLILLTSYLFSAVPPADPR